MVVGWDFMPKEVLQVGILWTPHKLLQWECKKHMTLPSWTGYGSDLVQMMMRLTTAKSEKQCEHEHLQRPWKLLAAWAKACSEVLEFCDAAA